MSNRKTQMDGSADAPVLEDSARTERDDAPLESAPPATEAPTPLPAFDPPAPSAWRDLPVASVLPPVAPLLPPASTLTPLEDRIHRLEAELTQLRAAPTRAPDPASAVVHKPGAFWSGVGSRLLAPSGPSIAPPPPQADNLASMIPAGVRRTWVILDAVTELRSMYWMFFDPRYRLSWLARLAPLVIGGLILTSGFWMPATSLPILGLVIEKVGDLVLAYILFKLLSHEARRFRETAPDLPRSLRQ